MKIRNGLLFLGLLLGLVSYAQDGSIQGTLLTETGEPAIFVNVQLEGTTKGTQSDFDGKFEITGIESGMYTLIISSVEYAEKRFENLPIADGVKDLGEIQLAANVIQVEGVTVTQTRRKDNLVAIIKDQQVAVSLVDAVPKEQIKNSGVSNATEVAASTPGISAKGGEVIARGLKGRYLSVQLNGMTLPSTKVGESSTPIDIFPAGLLENIETTKSFSPDLPGYATGGNINISTIRFPEKLQFNFSQAVSYNGQVNGNDNFLRQSFGKYDWLGYDDGSRAMNERLLDEDIQSVLVAGASIKARKDDEYAALVNEAAGLVNNEMAPKKRRSPIAGHSTSASVGGKFDVKGMEVGVLGGLSYRRSFAHYEGGTNSLYELNSPTATILSPLREMEATSSKESPSVNALLNVGVRPHVNHSFSFNTMYNHNADIRNTYQIGTNPKSFADATALFETRSMEFIERGFNFTQLSGDHDLENTLNGMQVNWGISTMKSFQDEPDRRLMANTVDLSDDSYSISGTEITMPFHFFRRLDDRQYSAKVDVEIPINTIKREDNFVKFGGFYSNKERVFKERSFQVEIDRFSGLNYDGNPEEFFADGNVGVIGYNDVRDWNLVGIYLTDAYMPSNNYNGRALISAAYGMSSFNINDKWKTMIGTRVEAMDYNIKSENEDLPVGKIKGVDLLPSANLIYQQNEKIQWRASYNRTIARPNMREMAPFTSFASIGDPYFKGNPELMRTQIDNIDLRWAWYFGNAEFITLSPYFKKFYNPIIQTFITQTQNPEITYTNVKEASVLGLEMNFRKKLDFVDLLEDFAFTANVTIIHSSSDIEKEALEVIQTLNPNFDPERPFAGQSPILINGGLNYTNEDLGLIANLTYRMYGDRLAQFSSNGSPDIYESGRHILNANVKKTIGKHIQLSFAVKNMLNSEFKTSSMFMGEEYINQNYRFGVGYSFGVKYNL